MTGRRSHARNRKFYLIQYALDDIYQVVSRSNIKFLKNTSIIQAKWNNGIFYEAKIIAKHPSKKVLTEIADNLCQNVPTVNIFSLELGNKSFSDTNKIQGKQYN